MAPTINRTTAQVVKYLESDLVYHQTEYIVSVWAKLGLPEDALTTQLRKLVESVNERRENGPMDLGEVDWEYLTRRYVDMFGDD